MMWQSWDTNPGITEDIRGILEKMSIMKHTRREIFHKTNRENAFLAKHIRNSGRQILDH